MRQSSLNKIWEMLIRHADGGPNCETRLKENKENSPCLAKVKGTNITVWGARRRILLDILMMCWGMGTWLGVNGVYVQLPLLVERLPEGWALPSSMVLAVQLGNTGILAYALLTRLRRRSSDVPYIYGLLVIGTCALVFNSFLYDRTAVIGGTERSFAFLTFTFFVALVGCTSSVLFYPHLRHFRDIYLATYLVGEGLSGFIPSILALVQGIGGEPECLFSADNSTLVPHYPPPLFNSTVFLLLLGTLSAISFISFTMINNLNTFKSEKVTLTADTNEESVDQTSVMTLRWGLVLMLMAVLNALYNGLMPSIQSYSCMPYGARAYHLAITLGSMANPAACLAGVWLRPLPAKVLGAALTLSTAPLMYMVTTAVLSPTPPFQHRVVGEALVVVSWVSVSAVISYSRMWIYGWARGGGARGMRACGAVGQLGSTVGSLVTYFLVNYVGVFTQPETCPTSMH